MVNGMVDTTKDRLQILTNDGFTLILIVEALPVNG